MDDETVADLASFDWSTLPALMRDKGMDLGIDLGIKVVTALAIFLIGKYIVRLVVKATATVMQKQEVDKTLETFICNLVRTVLMVVVVIAAIGAIGIETTSRRWWKSVPPPSSSRSASRFETSDWPRSVS